ncbi:CAP domain-containing protein [Nocardioides montaniterrae]
MGKIVTVITALLLSFLSAPPAHADPAPGGPDLAAYAAKVLDLTNQQRARHGCAALAAEPHLATAAAHHSQLMAARGIMSHLLGGELALVQRVLAAGYSHHWRRLAENVAAGYPSPRSVVRAWMASPGHRRHILDCRLHDLGVAVAPDRYGTLWWTQDFGSH